MPDEEISAWLSQVIKLIDQLGFGFLVKVYHDVAAKDHMKPFFKREGLVHKIEPTEDYLVFDPLHHGAVPRGQLGQIAVLPGGGQGLGALGGVYPLLGDLQHPVGQVGRQNLGIPSGLVRSEELIDEHGQGIGLFPRGAARAPDAQVMAGNGALKLGQNGVPKVVKMLGFPHEKGVVGGDLIHEGDGRFPGLVLKHIVKILRKAVKAMLSQHRLKPAVDQRTFFILEMNPIMCLNVVSQLPEFFCCYGNQ
ncbi:hypothetical protein SDC9_62360 [bioreactor metagenome]|uniref:Uncharacterized protein n=1 Tax=bioreactor metagenome TaxID=1076179 RepID=A0A644XIE4_9ZZZZ